MAANTDHTHHIKIRSTQMEMPSAGSAAHGPDYERKLQDAQQELERIQREREELERKKLELEELTTRKRNFVAQQVELSEKLTSALTLIDRELYEIRSETDDLEQCRACFADHLAKIEKFEPENWSGDNLREKLEKANMIIDIAADEYDQAAAHFEGTRSGSIFGRASTKRGRSLARNQAAEDFRANLRNGFAFNLPVLLLGTMALLIYLLK